MSAQHTPAPWTYGEDGFIYGGPDLFMVSDPHSSPEIDMDEREANARLIAQAPALLEALEQIGAMLDPGESHPPAMSAMLRKIIRIQAQAVRAAKS